MNKKRKILTVVALAVFAAVIGLHYVYLGFGETPYLEFRPPTYESSHAVGSGFSYHFETRTVTNNNVIKDVRMPLFVLAVFYVGLFALLGDKNAE